MTNDIERIGDHCMNLVLLAQRRFDKRYQFPEDTQGELNEMIKFVSEFVTLAEGALGPKDLSNLAEAKLLESKINKHRNNSRKRHARRMQDGGIGVREGLIYLDMMTNMEKIGDYCWNVFQTLRQDAEDH